MSKLIELENTFEELKECATKIREKKESIFLTSFFKKQTEIEEKVDDACQDSQEQMCNALADEKEIDYHEKSKHKKLYWVGIGFMVLMGLYGLIDGIVSNNKESLILGGIFFPMFTPILIYGIWKHFHIKSKIKSNEDFDEDFDKTMDNTYEKILAIVGDNDEVTAGRLTSWNSKKLMSENINDGLKYREFEETLELLNKNRINKTIEAIAGKQIEDLPEDFEEVNKQEYDNYRNAKNKYISLCDELALPNELRTAAAMDSLFSNRKENQGVDEQEFLKDFIKRYMYTMKPFSQLEKDVFSTDKYSQYKEDKQVYTSKVGVAIYDYMHLPASEQKLEWIVEQ